MYRLAIKWFLCVVTLVVALGVSSPAALAQSGGACVENGSEVTCTGEVTTGYTNTSGGLQVFVADGAHLSDVHDVLVLGDNNTITNNGVIDSDTYNAIQGHANNRLYNCDASPR